MKKPLQFSMLVMSCFLFLSLLVNSACSRDALMSDQGENFEAPRVMLSMVVAPELLRENQDPPFFADTLILGKLAAESVNLRQHFEHEQQMVLHLPNGPTIADNDMFWVGVIGSVTDEDFSNEVTYISPEVRVQQLMSRLDIRGGDAYWTRRYAYRFKQAANLWMNK